MSLKLHKLKSDKKPRKRLGRGDAGHGTYCGRGVKGQRARSGGKSGLKIRGFKQNLLTFPKFKGMKSHKIPTQIVGLSQLTKVKEEKINPGTLFKHGLIDTLEAPVKILLDKDKKDIKLNKDLEIYDCRVSASVKELIEKSGGKIVKSGEDKSDDKKKENKEEKIKEEKDKSEK